MSGLDKRIFELAQRLSQKYEVQLSQNEVNQLSDGLVVGYSRENTWENLEIQFEERLKHHLEKLGR